MLIRQRLAVEGQDEETLSLGVEQVSDRERLKIVI
jgi:hypothetical protein